MSSNGSDAGATADSSRAEGYRAVVERYQNEPNQCTIFPEDMGEDERVTTWISAKEPAYVDLWANR